MRITIEYKLWLEKILTVTEKFPTAIDFYHNFVGKKLFLL